jgi:hypothetical protein
MRKIITVTDWNSDELSRERFRIVVEGYSTDRKQVSIQALNSTSSSIHAGFLAYEMALTEAKNGDPTDTLIYIDVNTEQELYPPDVTVRSEGFAVIRLTNNLLVCGRISGYSFAWVKQSAQQLLEYTGLQNSSTVTILDSHARVVAHLADYLDDQLDLQSLHEADILSLPLNSHYICHKNKNTLVTTLNHSHLENCSVGDQVKIRIEDKSYSAHLVSGQKQESESGLIMCVGYYGHPDLRCIELMAKSTNIQDRFINVVPGDQISLA